MQGETKKPTQEQPILELWRILALALIVAAGMLFVHLVVPNEANASADRTTSVPGRFDISLK